jgi:predicted ABC-type transport system involved in lysophospholipase L1 biosynthesis ATPase subunit
MTRWRLHVYRQGGEWTEPARDTFAEVRADLERVGPDEDWVYIERQVDDGDWQRVAFAGFAPGLPDAWEYEP